MGFLPQNACRCAKVLCVIGLIQAPSFDSPKSISLLLIPVRYAPRVVRSHTNPPKARFSDESRPPSLRSPFLKRRPLSGSDHKCIKF